MSAPSGYTALDFVGFTDKGTYNPLATYMRNDLVHYSGNIWKCLVDNTTGITPVEGANWTLWIGTSANLAERTIAPLLNNPADAAFGVGRQVIYDDWLWEVIAPIAIGDTLIDYAVDPTNANIKKSNPVETQLLAVKAEADATDNMIAPTESNANSSSAAYAVGDQLILNNILYTVTAPVAIGDALVSGTGGNIEASDSLTDQLADKVDSSDLGTAAAKDSTNAVTQNSTDLVESGAVYSSVDALNTALTNVAKNALNTNFATRKVVFLGDSYNYSSGGWLSTLVAKLGISSSNYYNYTASGHSFNSDGWKNDITAFVTDHSDIKDEITDIIIVGGVNDATDSALARVENDITNFLSYVSTNMPNAYTTVAFVGGATQQSSVLNGRTYKNRMSAFYKYRAQLTTAKSRLLAGTYNALCDPTLFDTDGLHPNAYGNLAIAQMVAMALTSGNCNMIRDDGVNSASYVFNVRSGINNDYAYVHIDSAMIDHQTTIPANGSSSKLELSMPSACRIVNAPPILTKLKVANNTSYDVKVWIENANLCIQSCELANNTWASITTPGLGSFLMDMHFTKPTNDV